MTTRRDLDDELDQLIDDDAGGRFGAIYRRLPRAEPPPRIDRNVLAEAARAVHGRPPRRQRWQLALGSAAGIVLVAGIAWHVGHDALRTPVPAAFSRPELVPVQPLEPAATMRKPESRARRTPAAPPPAPSVAAPAASPSDNAIMRQATPAMTDAFEADRTAAPQRGQRARDSAAERSKSAPEHDVGRDTDNESAAARSPMPASSRDASSLSGGARPADMPANNDVELTSAAWIAHIRTLIRQGNRDEATKNLHAFRRTYPHVPLPPDLRALER